jgi:hypothetical protein
MAQAQGLQRLASTDLSARCKLHPLRCRHSFKEAPMKALLTAAALAIAFAAPAAEARVSQHHNGTHATSAAKVKTASKKTTKAKHKKAKKGHKKAA